MANPTFLDASGDWAAGANWTTATLPGAGDFVRVLDGEEDIDTNLNQAAVTIADLFVGAGFSGDIGASANTLRLNGNEFIFEGQGLCWLNGTWAKSVIRDCVPVENCVNLAGTHTEVVIRGGVGGVRIQTGATIGTLWTTPEASGCRVTIESGVTISTKVVVDGGLVVSSSNIPATSKVASGTLRMLGAATLAAELHSGGTIDHRASGAVTLVNSGGIFTGRRNLSAGAITMTSYRQLSGTTDLRSGGRHYQTWSAAMEVVGGLVYADPGQTMSPSA